MVEDIYMHKSKTKEGREKMRAIALKLGLRPPSRKGIKLSAIVIEKLKKYWSGRPRGPYSEERKRKISLAHLGKHRSEEHRRKIGLALLGNKYSLGRKMSDEERKMRSLAAPRGEKSYSWKGGITPINAKIRASLKYRLWREEIFKRDNYTCVWCKDNKGGNLNADHIKPFSWFPKLRFSFDNGQTLCETCHDWKTKMDLKVFRGKAVPLNIIYA